MDEAGEWKLAGVEFMHSHGETYVSPKHLEQLFKYDPPEISKSGAARRTEKWCVIKIKVVFTQTLSLSRVYSDIFIPLS